MFRFFVWLLLTLIASKNTRGDVSPEITQCGNLTCFNKGKCTTMGTKCMCNIGFKGLTCNEDLDECSLGDPCMHRGHCNNSFGGYRCVCLEGWSGESEHCRYRDNTTIFRCTQGWIGNMCQDKCLNNSMCRQNEVCKKRGRGLHCICANGWNGVNCAHDINECAKNPCPNKTICVNTLGSFHCKCIPGWKGSNCKTDIDECLVNPCQHLSSCMNAQGYYTCKCTSGWTGANCDDDVDECTNNPCNASSRCENVPGSFLCVDKSSGNEGMSGDRMTFIIVGSTLGTFLMALSIVIVLLVAVKYKWTCCRTTNNDRHHQQQHLT